MKFSSPFALQPMPSMAKQIINYSYVVLEDQAKKCFIKKINLYAPDFTQKPTSSVCMINKFYTTLNLRHANFLSMLN